MGITIDKRREGYAVNGFNKFNRFVTATVSETATVKEAMDAILEQKSETELRQEKIESDKDFLLSEWVVGKSDEELIGKAGMFKAPTEGMQIAKGTIYNYAGELYRALEDFKYDYQLSPHLEPKRWKKIGEKPKSNYKELFDKAVYWSRDESYEKDTYVKWYWKLYKALVKVTDNEEPGTGQKWELITED